MRITHLGHAAVLVETDQVRILIDPGAFSDGWVGLDNLDAVLVTHQHPDHLDPKRVPGLIAANPGASWYVEPSTVPLVPGQAAPLAAGDTVRIGDVVVTGVGGTHAVIHRSIPTIGNTGLLLRADLALFHPGDELDAVPEGVDVLAAPVNGPWCKVAETGDFVGAVAPARWFGIHDALLSDIGRNLYLDRISGIAGVAATHPDESGVIGG